jgi:hypothetical protein
MSKQVGDAVLTDVRKKIDGTSIMKVMLERGIGISAISDIFHILHEATTDAGYTVTPCISPEDITATNKRVKDEITGRFLFEATELFRGWSIKNPKSVVNVLTQMSHHQMLNDNSQSPGVVTLAFGVDACPLKRGKGAIFGSIEDVTHAADVSGEARVPHKCKSCKEAVTVVACETSGKETREVLKETCGNIIDAWNAYEEGLANKPTLDRMDTCISELGQVLSALENGEVELGVDQTTELCNLLDEVERDDPDIEHAVHTINEPEDFLDTLEPIDPHVDPLVMTRLRRIIHRKKATRTAWIARAVSKGWLQQCVENHVWVDVHVISDMAATRSMLGLEGRGSLRNFCHLCTCTHSEVSNLTKTWLPREGLQVGIKRLDSVFKIPIHKMHCCTVHCDCRVSECILRELLQYLCDLRARHHANSSFVKQIDHKIDTFLEVLNTKPDRKVDLTILEINPAGEVTGKRKVMDCDGLYCNSGNCECKAKREGYPRVSRIPLVGPDVDKFIHVSQRLAQYVFDHGAVDDVVDKLDHFTEAINEYQVFRRALKAPILTRGQRRRAELAASQFCHHWVHIGKLTHYMHYMKYHPEWIFSYDIITDAELNDAELVTPPCVWSTQAVERGHGRNKDIYYGQARQNLGYNITDQFGNTEHIKIAPAMLEVLLQGLKWLWCRLKEADRARRSNRHTLTLTDVHGLCMLLQTIRGVGVLEYGPLAEIEALRLCLLDAPRVVLNDELCRMCRQPSGTQIIVKGTGKIVANTIGITLCADVVYKAAAYKFESCGGSLIGDVSMGKRPTVERTEQVSKYFRIRNAKRRLAANREVSKLPEIGVSPVSISGMKSLPTRLKRGKTIVSTTPLSAVPPSSSLPTAPAPAPPSAPAPAPRRPRKFDPRVREHCCSLWKRGVPPAEAEAELHRIFKDQPHKWLSAKQIAGLNARFTKTVKPKKKRARRDDSEDTEIETEDTENETVVARRS